MIMLMLAQPSSCVGNTNKALFEERSAMNQQHQDIENYDDSISLNNNNNNRDDPTDLQGWLDAQSVAKYLGLPLTKRVHLRIPINFIFVGFNGDGNKAFSLEDHHLVEWFQHIEHSLPNVIVPLGEDLVTSDINETPATHIEYSFDIQVSKVDALVTTLIEDAIYWHLRNEDPSYYDTNATSSPQSKDTQQRFYTNPYLVSSLLSSLSSHLNLNTNSYSIYVLNPNHPLRSNSNGNDSNSASDEPIVYGYRTGLSNGELRVLNANPALVFNNEWKIESDYDFVEMFKPARGHIEPGEVQQSTLHINDNLKLRDLSKLSHEWARSMSQEFAKYRNQSATGGPATETCFYGSPDGTEDRWICTAPQLVQHDEEGMSTIKHAQNLYDNGNWFEKFYIQSAHNHWVQENCLVDSWISHKRFAFVDLTAGPFSWGPTIGGNGLKSRLTLPKVPDSLQDKITSIRQLVQNDKQRLEKLQQELTITQTLYKNTCSSTQVVDENCQNLKRNIAKLESILMDTVSWEPFFNNDDSPMHNIDLLLGNLIESVEEIEMNDFKAHLGAVLSDSLRHLVAQPQPLFKSDYYSRVNFHVIIISDHKQYNPRDHSMFNYELFKHQLDKLKSPGQEFTYNIKMIPMLDDPTLSLAYHTSLKTILQPTVNKDGAFETKLNYYIDSKEIKYQLTRLNPDQHSDDMQQVMKSKHIPIFIFSLGGDNAVFIDRDKRAKALDNMVIAVQTNVMYNSSFTCNDQPVTLNLSNPMSPLLAATALSLGGLVPNHVSYSEATMKATQNWQWSVGDSPTASTFTFPFSYFSEFQRDAIHRNYVVTALEKSITMANEANQLLANHKTNLQNYGSLEKIPMLRGVTRQYKMLQDQWRLTAEYIAKLDFGKAISTALHSERTAIQYLLEIKSLSEGITVADCNVTAEGYKIRTYAIITICLTINVLMLLAYFLISKTKSKLKIN
ncbi:hypothetical protein SAMD00019534_048540 [Acytostelium subglobosum LB1]|uniref:hypothetical protein n=1 Tax=Acytostelium subglobosum LB1 TaxID=1410327 RepID=UPI000644C700|nr:hypothetical protein SAMD00019534_048540 [Acytostelium subglobosum LB1]GAM21679.1 hypothetical protein SAMD00019534_048540 [Acytostelium subglobosum LB1]|eukprot:XP_012755798.1 hypothetical protein SAMD00019534_048540 [Acytostelium subglobosum LB1]